LTLLNAGSLIIKGANVVERVKYNSNIKILITIDDASKVSDIYYPYYRLVRGFQSGGSDPEAMLYLKLCFTIW